MFLSTLAGFTAGTSSLTSSVTVAFARSALTGRIGAVLRASQSSCVNLPVTGRPWAISKAVMAEIVFLPISPSTLPTST